MKRKGEARGVWMSVGRSGLVLLAGFLLLCLASCSTTPLHSAAAVAGGLDPGRALVFDGQGLLSLDGEWEYHPDRLLGPADFKAGEKAATTTAMVPGFWSEIVGFGKPARSPRGVGTLRLLVQVPSREREWALRVPNAYSATRVFVNGKAVAEIGRVSDDPASQLPSNGLAIPRFVSSTGRLEIIMQVSNFSAPYIGTWSSPILGDADLVLQKRQGDVATTALISGALVIMGLYHLGLFVLRKKDLASLIFGAICLLMTLRNLIMGERLLLDAFPLSVASWEWAFKLEHLSAHLTVPLFGLFFRKLFPRQVNRSVIIAIIGVGLAWAALVVLAPAMTYQRFLHWYEYFILVAAAYVLGAVVVAAFRRERGAIVVIAGLLLIIVTAVNDVLLSSGLVRTFYMASIGVFLYVFAQSFHLSMIFSKAFSDVETLSTSLIDKNRELESLHTIDLAIASSVDLEEVLPVVLKQAIDRLGVDAADILLMDESGECLTFGARTGFRTEALIHTRLKAGEGFAGRALESAGPVIVADLTKRAEGFSRSPAFSGEEFVFYAGRRLTVKGRIEGVLELYSRRSFVHTSSWELYFETLAGQAAVALDNSRLFQGLRLANEELREANEAAIEGWAEALELRDQETEGHSRRVTSMTLDLAARFGISGAALEQVRNGALLHDIGKMGIPDSILLKPGPLTDEEFTIMKKHPEIALDLLSRLKFLDHALDIPYGHHEKWDGSGYPRRPAGTAIPLPARIFAIIDVWDALRSDRPYRKSWTEERVLEHVLGLSGSHFDPAVVEAFVAMQGERKGPPAST